MLTRPWSPKYGFALSAAFAGTLWFLVSIGLSIILYADHHSNAYSLLNHFVSELGWGKTSRGAWLFNTGLTVAGVTWIPLLWETGRSIGTVLGRVAGVIGITTAAAGSLVGVIPMDRIVPHLVVAGAYFFTLPITMVVFDLALVRSGKRGEAKGLLWASYAVLIVWLGFIVCPKDLLITALHNQWTFVRPTIWALALLEWILVLCVGLWMLTCAAYLARSTAVRDPERSTTNNDGGIAKTEASDLPLS